MQPYQRLFLQRPLHGRLNPARPILAVLCLRVERRITPALTGFICSMSPLLTRSEYHFTMYLVWRGTMERSCARLERMRTNLFVAILPGKVYYTFKISNFCDRPEMTQLDASGQNGMGLRIECWSQVKDEEVMLWIIRSESNLLVKNRPPTSLPTILLP